MKLNFTALKEDKQAQRVATILPNEQVTERKSLKLKVKVKVKAKLQISQDNIN